MTHCQDDLGWAVIIGPCALHAGTPHWVLRHAGRSAHLPQARLHDVHRLTENRQDLVVKP